MLMWSGRTAASRSSTPAALIPHSDDVLLSQMRRQAEIAMDTADVICFFADGRDGLTDDDREVANLLRKTKKPILLVVNKVDHISMNDNIYEFYELGLGDPIAISAANMLGLGDLLQAICEKLPPAGKDEMDETEHILQLAVVGRPNVGKSSLVNRLVGSERTMVSDIAGTTRDAIDTLFTVERHAVQHHRHCGHPPQARRGGRDARSATAYCGRLLPSAAATWRCCSSTRRTA